MKNITFKGKKYSIPISWDEITLEQQQKVTEDGKEFKTDYLKKLAIISGYAQIPVKEIKTAKTSEVNRLWKYLKFINESLPNNMLHEFEFNGEMYYVGETLLEERFEDYISLRSILDNNENNVTRALHQIIAVLAKRKIYKGTEQEINIYLNSKKGLGKMSEKERSKLISEYKRIHSVLEESDDYDVDKRAEEFKQLPISIANGIGFFLQNNLATSQILTQLYSNPKEIILRKVQEVQNSLKIQDGMGLLSRFLILILRVYLKFLKRSYMMSLTSMRSRSTKVTWIKTLMKSIVGKRNKKIKK